MAKGGKVYHWKHGWIPVSPEAKAYVAGHGPKPSAVGAPNEKLGLPSRGGTDRFAEGQQRAADLEELMPGLGRVEPHYQFASQDMRAHHTGGVVLAAHQADFMIDELQRTHEGTATRTDTFRAAGGGRAPLPSSVGKYKPREVAERRARRIKEALDLKYTPTPEYQPILRGPNGSPEQGYTGGLVFQPTVADDLLDKLEQRFTGTTTHRQSRKAAGLPALDLRDRMVATKRKRKAS